MVKFEICEIGRMRYEPLGNDVEVAAEGAGEVLIATKLVTGSAVKSVPSILEDVGAAVVMRILYREFVLGPLLRVESRP